MSKPTGRARELGAALRRYREAAGWTESRLARTLSLSHGQVCRIELGQRGISEVNVARCLTLYGVFGAEHDEIMSLVKEVNDNYRLHAHNDRLPDELRTLIHYETTATSIDSYQPLLIPGLLQTEDYARALFHWAGTFPEDGIETRVMARMNRQEVLRRPDHPRFRFFIHESALQPPTISADIMHEQLMTLLLASNWRDCSVRIVPAAAGPHGALGGAFMFLCYGEYLPTVYVENVSTSAFLEDPVDVRHYRAIVNRLADLALSEGESREMLANLAT
jgi:transcriptional regulator with XRE-family HTH domain